MKIFSRPGTYLKLISIFLIKDNLLFRCHVVHRIVIMAT